MGWVTIKGSRVYIEDGQSVSDALEKKRAPKLHEQKGDAKYEYKQAKEAYLKNRTEENWKRFCEAKSYCMRLGVRI